MQRQPHAAVFCSAVVALPRKSWHSTFPIFTLSSMCGAWLSAPESQMPLRSLVALKVTLIPGPLRCLERQRGPERKGPERIVGHGQGWSWSRSSFPQRAWGAICPHFPHHVLPRPEACEDAIAIGASCGPGRTHSRQVKAKRRQRAMGRLRRKTAHEADARGPTVTGILIFGAFTVALEARHWS